MTEITATIDTHIKFDPAQIDSKITKHILDCLTIDNYEKVVAERQMLYRASDMDDYIELWEWNNNGELVLPRGFLGTLGGILLNNSIVLNVVDNTESDDNYLCDVPQISLRVYQNRAVFDLIENEYGIYKAPTGAGKTRVMLELARECHQKTLVICEKKDILSQWSESAMDLHFDDTGTIGNGTWFEGPDIVFALRQSLINRGDLDQDWFNQWGMVILDECHHCAADTMFDLLQRFPARYRFGCSATPDSDPETFPIAKAVLGPVVHETSEESAAEALITPRVKVIDTDFEFDYHPTRVVEDNFGNKKIIRNNYNKMMKFLEEDRDRNDVIVGLALQESLKGNCCIVLSKRKKHLEYIIKSINSAFISFNEEWKSRGIEPTEVYLDTLTGENSSEFNSISSRIESYKYGSILFSTLAEEGTDIPKLDRLFLTYPGRKTRGFEQAIGRIMRKHPNKKDAIVYDFRDKNVSLLNGQFRERAQRIYNKRKYEVEYLTPSVGLEPTT